MIKKHPKLHFQRFEIKYVLPNDKVDLIIPDLLYHMNSDPYADREDGSYTVTSLYYDSPDYKFFHEKMNGQRRRKKLRFRTYEKSLNPESKIFMEIKRKHDALILKDRIELEFSALNDNFSLNNFQNLLGNMNHSDKKTMEEFIWTKLNFNMRPSLLVKYLRMPFVGKSDSRFRVTIDRNIEAKATNSLDPNQECLDYSRGQAVLEVKFNNTLPSWFYHLIQKFMIDRTSFSKYCGGLIACRPHCSYIFDL